MNQLVLFVVLTFVILVSCASVVYKWKTIPILVLIVLSNYVAYQLPSHYMRLQGVLCDNAMKRLLILIENNNISDAKSALQKYQNSGVDFSDNAYTRLLVMWDCDK